MQRVLGSLVLAIAALALPVQAQPDLSRRVGMTVADTGVAGYRFESIRIEAAAGGQAYRLRVALPERAPAAAGYASAWLLDGNAALMDLQAETLRALAQSVTPPVIVFVAHDNDLRVDGDARAYDYTPRRPGGEEAQRDPLGTRRNGGADAFLALLQEQALPRVNALARLDPARKALWGHSYGGVFVLHVLFTRPQSFALFGAADPSLWWGDGYLLKEEARAAPLGATPPRLQLWLGDASRAPPDGAMVKRSGVDPATSPAANPAAVDAMRRARQSVPADAAQQMALRLKTRGMPVDVALLAGKSHGQTLAASLPLFLAAVAGTAP